MSKAADEAFEHARERIVQAKQEGWAKLDFFASKFVALETLPPEIAGLPNLTWLSLRGTSVSDVSTLSGLTGLTSLNLRDTRVSDVSALSGLTGLTSLNLGYTQVSDVSALSGLTGLTFLDLGGTGVSDVSALDGMRGLQFLNLRGTEVARTGLERAVRGKPGLVPPETRNALAGPMGVQFLDCAAAKADRELARIAEIDDGRDRTLALFGYLGIKVDEGGGSVELPARRPAPLEVEITDTAIVFAGSQGLPASDATTRAEMGWEALKEYRDNFASGFAIHNYQPLPRRLADFDRAMGDRYDPRNVVRIWSQGQRIQQLAKDPEFLAMLPVGVPDDLKGFAAAISLYAERFPDVIAYRDDVSPDDRSPDNVRAGAAAFRAIDAVLSQMPEAELAVKEEYRAEVEAGTSETADTEASKAVVVSTGELYRETAEKTQQKHNRDLANKGGELVEDLILKPLGLPYYLARKLEKPGRALAKRFPNSMGWLTTWYDLTFGAEDNGPEDKGPKDGAAS